MTLYDFLDNVCVQVKYRSIHNEIRNELSEHIFEIEENENLTTEQAVAVMGDPTEIGKSINANYHLPFNSRYGLHIWAALITAVICLAYPYIKASSQTNAGFGIMLIIIAVYSILCGFVLKPSKVHICLRDMGSAVLGSFVGSISSLSIVYAVSMAFEQGVYPYFNTIDIPLGINLKIMTFVCLMILWVVFVYLCSCKLIIRKRTDEHIIDTGIFVEYIFPEILVMRGQYSDEIDNLKSAEQKRKIED